MTGFALMQRGEKMTNSEAIKILERLQEPEPWEPQITREAYQALEVAIEALEFCVMVEDDGK